MFRFTEKSVFLRNENMILDLSFQLYSQRWLKFSTSREIISQNKCAVNEQNKHQTDYNSSKSSDLQLISQYFRAQLLVHDLKIHMYVANHTTREKPNIFDSLSEVVWYWLKSLTHRISIYFNTREMSSLSLVSLYISMISSIHLCIILMIRYVCISVVTVKYKAVRYWEFHLHHLSWTVGYSHAISIG